MKLTLDSAESLEDAMRVVGALYGVQLAIASERVGNVPETKAPAAAATQVSGAIVTPVAERAGRAKTTRARRAAGAKPARRTRTAQSRRTAEKTTARSNFAQVRAWARQSGLKVSDRGPLAASVLSAYRDAHAQ